MGLVFTGNDNREAGKDFEDVFQQRANTQGLLPIRNYPQCKITYNGRAQIIKGRLDWDLIRNDGRVAHVDCKNFSSDFFTYSSICEHQLKRAIILGSWHVPSGFVVLFQPTNQVVYFTGHSIQQKGPRSRFEAIDGRVLGTIVNFDLKLIYSSPTAA